jgi:hypothetical protein
MAALDLDDERLRATRAASIADESFISKAISAVFGYLARPSALSTNMRLLQGDKEVPRELWSVSQISHGQVVHTELVAPFIDDALINGDLVVIDSIDECDPTMMFLREALEYALSARVWINVYITATSANSFGPHADDMDTIIVQLFGRKRWIVAAGPAGSSDSFPGSASMNDLSPGSALAVPAGTFHDVTGLGELALHLTIGFDQKAGLLRRLRALDQSLGLRTPDLSRAELQMAKAMLPDRRVGSSLPFQATRDHRHCRYVRWASQLPPIVRVMDNGNLEVTSMGHQVQFNSELTPTVQALASGREFELDELIGISGVKREAIVNFLLENVEAGFVICRI